MARGPCVSRFQFYDMQDVRYDEIGPWTYGSWMGLEKEQMRLLDTLIQKNRNFSKVLTD